MSGVSPLPTPPNSPTDGGAGQGSLLGVPGSGLNIAANATNQPTTMYVTPSPSRSVFTFPFSFSLTGTAWRWYLDPTVATMPHATPDGTTPSCSLFARTALFESVRIVSFKVTLWPTNDSSIRVICCTAPSSSWPTQYMVQPISTTAFGATNGIVPTDFDGLPAGHDFGIEVRAPRVGNPQPRFFIVTTTAAGAQPAAGTTPRVIGRGTVSVSCKGVAPQVGW